MLGVGQERERELVLLLELHVRGDGVRADAEDDGAALAELAERVADPAGLGGAARSVVLRVEVEDDRLPPERGERHRLVAVGLELEVGCGLTFLDHSRILAIAVATLLR